VKSQPVPNDLCGQAELNFIRSILQTQLPAYKARRLRTSRSEQVLYCAAHAVACTVLYVGCYRKDVSNRRMVLHKYSTIVSVAIA
jgi:hypothetical protein